MLNAVLAEGGRQGRAGKACVLINVSAEPRELFASIIGCIRRSDKDGRLALCERFPDLIEAEDRRARSTCEAERVKRAPFKAGGDIIDEAFRRHSLLLEGAREKALGDGARQQLAIGANPRAAPAELFGEIGRDDAVRR